MGHLRTLAGVVLLVSALVACGGSDGGSSGVAETIPDGADQPVDGDERPSFVDDVFAAIDAVEKERGTGQRYFEVTANAQFTNVFVAVDDATAAIAYVFVDGELQSPAPKQTGAEGETFTAADVGYDPSLVLSGVSADLPNSEVDAISVYGDGVGATYVLAATSEVGGFLDIVVGPQGQVLSVDPL